MGFSAENRIHSRYLSRKDLLQEFGCLHTCGRVGGAEVSGQLLLLLLSHLALSQLPTLTRLVGDWTLVQLHLLGLTFNNNSSWKTASTFLPNYIILTDPKIHPSSNCKSIKNVVLFFGPNDTTGGNSEEAGLGAECPKTRFTKQKFYKSLQGYLL